jgi:uncharacterized protein (TIGR02145 family)
MEKSAIIVRILLLATALSLASASFGQSAYEYFVKGSSKNGMGDYKGAIDDYTKAIELDPKIEFFYNYRGNTYDSLKKSDEAFADYAKAIELNPKYVDPYINRGILKYKVKDYHGAIADFNKTIEIFPEIKNYSLYYYRGLAKYKLQNYGGAIADFTRASEIRPKIKEPYYYKELAIIEMGDTTDAIEYYSKAIKLDPENVLLYNYRGNTYDSLHYSDNAIADYTKAIELNPHWEKPYYSRGILKYKLQDYSGAIADFTKTIEIIHKKDAYFPYYYRGLAKYNLQDYRGAIEDFIKAIDIDPYLEKKAYYYRDLAKTEFDKNRVGSLTNAFIDSRDGHVYKLVKFGDQTWMAENLAYLPSISPGSKSSKTYEDYYVYGYNGYEVSKAKNETNYATYGVLYNWEAANSACPAGWHLPDKSEWLTLDRFLGDSLGGKLGKKGYDYFYIIKRSKNKNGFMAVQGGCRKLAGSFRYLDKRAYFWSASEYAAMIDLGSLMHLSYFTVLRTFISQNRGFSVRCLRNEANVPAADSL